MIKQISIPTVFKTTGLEAQALGFGDEVAKQRHEQRRQSFGEKLAVSEGELDAALEDGYRIIAQYDVKTERFEEVVFVLFKSVATTSATTSPAAPPPAADDDDDGDDGDEEDEYFETVGPEDDDDDLSDAFMDALDEISEMESIENDLLEQELLDEQRGDDIDLDYDDPWADDDDDTDDE